MESLCKLWLATQLPIGSTRFGLLIDRFSSAQSVYENLSEIAAQYPNLIHKKEYAALASMTPEEYAAKFSTTISEYDISVFFKSDDEYPNELKLVPHTPNVLFVRGKLPEQDDLKIAVVGTRKASDKGKTVTRSIVSELCNNGAVVVSGLAYGIDAFAAETALSCSNNECKTVAILGCGVDVVYPTANKKLYSRIAEEGALVSQFLPGARPTKFTFPQRNYTIASLSDCVFVPEVGYGSGSLITARDASRLGKRVFFFSRKITTASDSNQNALRNMKNAVMLKDTSNIFDAYKNSHNGESDSDEKCAFFEFITHYSGDVTPIEDCCGVSFDDVGRISFFSDEPTETSQTQALPQSTLSATLTTDELVILTILSDGPKYFDELFDLTGFSAEKLNALLTSLEFDDVILQMQGRLYSMHDYQD